ncbi:MAG: SURF1 family protein [Hyphomicrobiales bacterium]
MNAARSPQPPLRRAGARGLLLPATFTIVGVAALCALGAWQLERKAWKEGLIAAITERTGAPPSDFPPEGAWASLSPEQDEYRHVRLAGRFLNDSEAHLQANLVSKGKDDGALGYDILTPLRTAEGALVIVNRGFVPLARKEASSRPDGQIEGETVVTGLIRFPQPHSWFVPADDPKGNVWFSRDPAPIAEAYGLAHVAPVIIDADPEPADRRLPLGGQTRLTLPNDHLQYALTWFALAVALAGVFGAYALRRKA